MVEGHEKRVDDDAEGDKQLDKRVENDEGDQLLEFKPRTTTVPDAEDVYSLETNCRRLLLESRLLVILFCREIVDGNCTREGAGGNTISWTRSPLDIFAHYIQLTLYIKRYMVFGEGCALSHPFEFWKINFEQKLVHHIVRRSAIWLDYWWYDIHENEMKADGNSSFVKLIFRALSYRTWFVAPFQENDRMNSFKSALLGRAEFLIFRITASGRVQYSGLERVEPDFEIKMVNSVRLPVSYTLVLKSCTVQLFPTKLIHELKRLRNYGKVQLKDIIMESRRPGEKGLLIMRKM